MTKNRLKITIVGGGPVGLFLGICLTNQGFDCTIIEKRAKPISDSRSLGIHPISLELFERIGVVEDFLQKGIQISKGLAHDGSRILGEIDFAQLEDPYNFILACPQFYTENILTKKFLELNPNGLVKSALVSHIQQNQQEASCWYQKDNEEFKLTSDYIIGCDGKNSIVRLETGIFYRGTNYPDTYIMGDFEDNTSYGDKAVIFLPKGGLIECFPLPNNMRRWVVKTDFYIESPSNELISKLVNERVNIDLRNLNNTMLSSFRVQNFVAESFFANRIILCGDAAHVVSPIGGQGMNLGWIGAWKLSAVFSEIQNNQLSKTSLLSEYQNQQKKIVEKASKRAEWNMRMGRKQFIPLLNKALIYLILKTPLSKIASQKFTMKKLK